MHPRTRLATALAPLALLAVLATLSTAAAALISDTPRAPPAPSASAAPAAQPADLRALDGVWVYVEDRTEGRAPEDHSPNMGPKLTYRVEKDAFVLVRSREEIRIPLDGSPTVVAIGNSKSTYSGQWKDGAFEYESEPDDQRAGGRIIRWTLRPIALEGGGVGMLGSVSVGGGAESVALFRHPQDIALPTPAKATIGDMAWLAGAWVGKRGTGGTTSIEERWTPPLGGAMLAVSRTVSRDQMRAFEFLRIVEREGGLVYVAQPNGAPKTEFVLTELSKTRAVFENPRHDSPQRIVYELSDDGKGGKLTASIGFANGGRPQRFEYEREEKSPPTPAP